MNFVWSQVLSKFSVFLSTYLYELEARWNSLNPMKNRWKKFESPINQPYTLPEFAEIWYNDLLWVRKDDLVIKGENDWQGDGLKWLCVTNYHPF